MSLTEEPIKIASIDLYLTTFLPQAPDGDNRFVKSLWYILPTVIQAITHNFAMSIFS